GMITYWATTPMRIGRGLRATRAKSGTVSVRPIANMMMPREMLGNCAGDWPTAGTKEPHAAAARIRAGKTVTAMRAERSSEVRAADGAVPRGSSVVGEEGVMPRIVPACEMTVRHADAWGRPDRRRGVGGRRTRPRVPPPRSAPLPRRDRPGVDRVARVHRGAVEPGHLRERLGPAGAAHLERGDGVDLPAGAVAAGTGAFGEDAAVVRGHVGLRPEAPQPLHGLRDQVLEQEIRHPHPAHLGPAHPGLQAPTG